MRILLISITVVSILGCSSPAVLSPDQAVVRAWREMETVPPEDAHVSMLIQKQNLRAARVDWNGHDAWHVLYTRIPPGSGLVKADPLEAIAAPPGTTWVVILEAKSGEILWQERNRVR